MPTITRFSISGLNHILIACLLTFLPLAENTSSWRWRIWREAHQLLLESGHSGSVGETWAFWNHSQPIHNEENSLLNLPLWIMSATLCILWSWILCCIITVKDHHMSVVTIVPHLRLTWNKGFGVGNRCQTIIVTVLIWIFKGLWYHIQEKFNVGLWLPSPKYCYELGLPHLHFVLTKRPSG